MVKIHITGRLGNTAEFKKGYEFQLQRKLYRQRSVAVEMHFISYIHCIVKLRHCQIIPLLRLLKFSSSV